MFGYTEQSTSLPRARGAVSRLRRWLAEREDIPAVVLTGPGAVAWVTGGVGPPVDRTASIESVWAVVGPSTAALVTTEVEHARILDEYDPAAHGFELTAVPWYDSFGFVAAAEDAAGAEATVLATDGHAAFGVDASDELISLRLALSDPEREDLRHLGADAASALEDALREWRPGDRDLDVQARVAAPLEARGADTPVLIVGGDERIRRYRHPLASGAPVQRRLMAVLVARRAGLHVAATRFASAGPLDPESAALRERALRVDHAVLAASRPHATYGDALDALEKGYANVGAPDAWTGHYQGGPIGYAQREFEIAPCQRDSRWYAEPITSGHAVAWNPSLPGGAKVEDTYLVSDAGLERVTASETWPAEENDEFVPARPSVLEVGS